MRIQSLIIVVMLSLSSPAMAMSTMMESATSQSLIGSLAPEFSLEKSSGTTQSLTQARAGKKAILFFWATWCPHCHDQLKMVDGNLNKIKEKGIQILLVNVGESREEAKAYLQHQKLSLETFMDEDNVVAGQYGVRGVPNLIFIDEQGIVRHRDYGLDSNFETKFQSN